jgi:microsomal epoxide hydrolase
MFYLLTGTAGSSARLYYEFMHSGQDWTQPEPHSDVPTGVSVFPCEIAPAIRGLASPSYNITHWSEFDRGGHFAALEEPDLLVQDIREFFTTVR